jgi:hypothetical protein
MKIEPWQMDVLKNIRRDFRINERGRITSPGKFEGEMCYVPYYWEIYLNGFADRDDGQVLGFDISAEDKFLFPMLRKRRTVKLYARDDGFVVEI